MQMRRAFSAGVMGTLALLVGGPQGAPFAIAEDASITAWIEFATIAPGVGCAVDVSADGGPGLTGADVSLVVSDDASGAVISSDSSTADSSGVAWLKIDTSGASPGVKTWASVFINGTYFGGRTVRVTSDGDCSGESSLVKLDGSMSSSPSSSAEAEGSDSSEISSSSVIVPGAFGYQQERRLSCEYAALAIATGMLGDWVSEYDFEAVMPLSVNPHWGYRGDITGSWGNTTDYGVYAAALVPALEQHGFQGDVFYGGRGDLTYQLDRGRPTLVWIGARGEAGSFYEWTADGSRYQLTPYMHVVVVYGYDDGGVYISDPGNGALSYWDWASFEGMWDVMDGMSLAVHW
jgi:uncharacterized protein YvpB